MLVESLDKRNLKRGWDKIVERIGKLEYILEDVTQNAALKND